SLRSRKAIPSAGRRLSKARTIRLSRPVETPSPPSSKENSPASSTSSSRNIAIAAAIASYPGPRLAEEAGTRTSRWRAVIALIKHGPLDGAEVVLAVDHRGGFGEGGVGVLEAVAGEDADDGLGLGGVVDGRQAVGEEAGYRGSAGGLAEDAFVVGEPAVGVQDLFVGNGGDATAGGGEGGHRLLPARRVADPDR